MKKIILSFMLFASLVSCKAQNISNFPSAATPVGTDLFGIYQPANTGWGLGGLNHTYKLTLNGLNTYFENRWLTGQANVILYTNGSGHITGDANFSHTTGGTSITHTAAGFTMTMGLSNSGMQHNTNDGTGQSLTMNTDAGGAFFLDAVSLTNPHAGVYLDGSEFNITNYATTWRLPHADGTIGQSLITDGAGQFSFATTAAPIYPSSQIVFGDGSTVGGTTSSDFSYNDATKDFIVGYGGTGDCYFHVDPVSKQIIARAGNAFGTQLGISDAGNSLSLSDATGAGLYFAGSASGGLSMLQGLGIDMVNNSFFLGDNISTTGMGLMINNTVSKQVTLGVVQGGGNNTLLLMDDALNTISLVDGTNAGFFFAGSASSGLGTIQGIGIDHLNQKVKIGNTSSVNYFEVDYATGNCKVAALAGSGMKMATIDNSGVIGTTSLPPTISNGVVAPVSTPAKIGDMFIDTVLKKIYVATGTSSSADWTIVN